MKNYNYNTCNTYNTYKAKLHALHDALETDFTYDEICECIYDTKASCPESVPFTLAMVNGRFMQAVEEVVQAKFNKSYDEWFADHCVEMRKRYQR